MTRKPKSVSKQFVVPRADAPTSDDAKAQKESISFTLGKDISDKKLGLQIEKLDMDGAVQGHLHNLIVCFLYLAFLLLAACAFVMVWHFVVPESWLFLTDVRLEKLRSFLFSGGVGAGVTALAKSKLVSKEENGSLL
ncbi:MAG: hypothetical protein COB78_09975 [Hyphomicrobiales bacterium]|nr:MAG: hypothetical protein COB78_09975 [Hyphomicrobiales bacterium]